MPLRTKENNQSKPQTVSETLLGAIEQYIACHYVEAVEEVLFFAEENVLHREACIKNTKKRVAPPVYYSSVAMCADAAPENASPENAKRMPKKTEKRSLESLIDNLDETFSEMLLRLIDERGLKDSEVYRCANIDRRHFSKIRNNTEYLPTKKTVIAFAIALRLTLDETVDLMNRAGYAFSKSSKFDVIICFFLENRSYDIFEINEVLFRYGQPILGE